jgi:hypothetical protein
MPGVICVLTTRVGDWMLTTTAWEDTEGPRQSARRSRRSILRLGLHHQRDDERVEAGTHERDVGEVRGL